MTSGVKQQFGNGGFTAKPMNGPRLCRPCVFARRYYMIMSAHTVQDEGLLQVFRQCDMALHYVYLLIELSTFDQIYATLSDSDNRGMHRRVTQHLKISLGRYSPCQ